MGNIGKPVRRWIVEPAVSPIPRPIEPMPSFSEPASEPARETPAPEVERTGEPVPV